MNRFGKSKKVKLSCGILIGFLLFNMSTVSLKAISDRQVRNANIIGTSLFTLVRGLIEGKVKNLKDAALCLAFGAAAGYGFYQSKSLVAKGRVWQGVLLANLSTSAAENVARGENPLSYLGYQIGPLRVNLATPFARRPPAILNIDFSITQSLGFVYSLTKSQLIKFKDGLIVFASDDKSYATGVFPTVSHPFAYRHEVIHVVQSLQLMSIAPGIYTPDDEDTATSNLSFIKFRGIRFDAYNLLHYAYHKLTPYEKRWYEKEAYHFCDK